MSSPPRSDDVSQQTPTTAESLFNILAASSQEFLGITIYALTPILNAEEAERDELSRHHLMLALSLRDGLTPEEMKRYVIVIPPERLLCYFRSLCVQKQQKQQEQQQTGKCSSRLVVGSLNSETSSVVISNSSVDSGEVLVNGVFSSGSKISDNSDEKKVTLNVSPSSRAAYNNNNKNKYNKNDDETILQSITNEYTCCICLEGLFTSIFVIKNTMTDDFVTLSNQRESDMVMGSSNVNILVRPPNDLLCDDDNDNGINSSVVYSSVPQETTEVSYNDYHSHGIHSPLLTHSSNNNNSSNSTSSNNNSATIREDINNNNNSPPKGKEILLPETTTLAELACCGSLYHYNCLSKWCEKNRTCPLCRAEISDSSSSHIKKLNERRNEIDNMMMMILREATTIETEVIVAETDDDDFLATKKNTKRTKKTVEVNKERGVKTNTKIKRKQKNRASSVVASSRQVARRQHKKSAKNKE